MNRAFQLLSFVSMVTALFASYLAYTTKIEVFQVKNIAIRSVNENAQLRSNISKYVVWELMQIKHIIEDPDANADLIGFRILALTQIMPQANDIDIIRTSLDEIFNKAKSTPSLNQLADVMKSNIARFRE